MQVHSYIGILCDLFFLLFLNFLKFLKQSRPIVNCIEDQILRELDKPPRNIPKLAQNKNYATQLLQNGPGPDDSVIMQHSLHRTLLHDKILVHFFTS